MSLKISLEDTKNMFDSISSLVRERNRLKEINRELVKALEHADEVIEEEWGRGSDIYRKVIAKAKAEGRGER